MPSSKIVPGLCAAVIAGALAAGCVATAPKTVTLPETVPIASKLVWPDAKLAIAGIVRQMRGDGAVQGVRFAAGTTLAEPGFQYEGFNLRQTKITGYHLVPGDDSARKLTGLLHFEDAVGRRTAVAFRADYTIAKSEVTLTAAQATTVFPTVPEARLYVAPLDEIEGKLEESATYADLQRLVVEKAVPPSRAGAAAASRDYVLLAFLRDRTEAKAGVKILLSADRQQLGNSNVGYTKGGQMLNYGGWMVAMLPVNFKPFGKDDLYAKVVYTPGRDATGGTRMVATYALGGEQAGL